MRNQYDFFLLLVKNIEKVSALPKEIEIFNLVIVRALKPFDVLDPLSFHVSYLISYSSMILVFNALRSLNFHSVACPAYNR